MKCLILAAGYATRLYPLTENFPKPLLPVRGKTILDWLIDDIESGGAVDEYVVISNHKYYPNFCDWAKDKPYKVTVLDDGTVSNETRLGAVKDIAFAVSALSLDTDLLVIAGDNVLDFSLCRFVDYSLEKNTSCIMRYYESDRKRLLKSGVATVDEGERVTKMTEKSPDPESNWCTPPFYFYKRTDVPLLFSAIEDGCSCDAPGSFISYLCQKSTIHAMVMPGSRYDIGDVESYRSVCESYLGITK